MEISTKPTGTSNKKKLITVKAWMPDIEPILVDLTFSNPEIQGSGSFGLVYRAKLMNGEIVAIKKVILDKRYLSRELQTLLELDHCNIIKLKYYFDSEDKANNCLCRNLVFEYMPHSLAKVIKHYFGNKSKIASFPGVPISLAKVLMYQLFRGLGYLHSIDISHRDIKPENLLIDLSIGVLKICDFGSAKRITQDKNVSYICARFYRAPELLFGSTRYTKAIDIWSAGCVVAQVFLGDLLFNWSKDSVGQMANIIKVLGTPSKEQIREMNPKFCEYDFPQIEPCVFAQLFPSNVPLEGSDLISKCLLYKPSARITPFRAMAHPFFDELRDRKSKISKAPLFNFTENELKIEPDLNSILVPSHITV